MPAPGREADHHHFGVLAAVGLIVVLEALSYWNTNALMSSMSRLEQTQQLIEALHAFGADLSTAEAATRAYLLSGDRGYVEPVDPAIVRANDVLRAVRPLIAGNPRQVSHFNSLEFFTANLVSSLRDSIAMQPHSASNDSIGADLTPGELMLMAEIRRVVTVMQREEKSLVVDRQRRIKARSDRILFTVLAGTVTSFAILGTVYYFLRREVRERQRAEHLLKRREETLHTLFESSPDAIVVVDRYGKIVRANQRIEEVFGYRPAELTGMPVEVLVPEHFAAQHVSHRRDYMTAPSTRPMGPGKDLCGKRKDGQEFPAEVMLSPAETDDGPIIICVVRDISERKRTVAMLAERTEDLVRVNGELLRSNQELEDFAYIASHDLKEPLRGLHNYALFLMEDYGEQLDEEGRAKLSTLARLSQRMDALIDSLLEYSRVGRVDLAIGEIDLNAVVHEAIESLSISLRQAGVPIRIPQPLPTLRCDKARIGEVFRNLITNAMKYNDKEDKWMEIGWLDSRCRGPAEPSNGTSCQSAPAAPVLYVRDNGIGIAERYHESIFRIFKRLHGRDKYGGGTGAGLTIARRIIERHGGRIWVESSLGQGATFYFTLGGEEDNLDGKYERHTNHSPR
jgi:PAS domain S-box-containing protein